MDVFFFEKTKEKISKAGTKIKSGAKTAGTKIKAGTASAKIKIKTGATIAQKAIKEKSKQGLKYIEGKARRNITGNMYNKKIPYKEAQLTDSKLNDYLNDVIAEIQNKISRWDELSVVKRASRYVINLKKMRRKTGKHLTPINFKGTIGVLHKIDSASSAGPFELKFDITWSHKYKPYGKKILEDIFAAFDNTLTYYHDD